MAFALKSKNTDCYVSDRVFDGVRVMDREAAEKHVARVKRLLSRQQPIEGEAAKMPTSKARPRS